MTWVYVLSKKSDVAETVKTDWLPMVERQQDRLVKAIRTDQGGEFLSKEFSLWLKKNGIRHSLTMPYSPAMNGIAERANRTITETACRLLIEAGLPDYFWPDAVRSACVAKNRALTHVGAEKWVPYVEWIGRKPKVDMLRVFGCMCMALVPKHLRLNKLGAKAIWAVHLGMAKKSKGWLLWDAFTKKFLVSRDFKFMENLMYKDWKAENEAKIGMRFGEVKSFGLEHVELPLELSSGSTTTRQSSLVNGGEEAKDAEEEEEEVQQCEVLEEIGFTPSSADHSLFMLGEGEQRSFMVVYVDDILIFSPSSDLVKEVMLKLQEKFKCKALGDVSFYLGLHICYVMLSFAFTSVYLPSYVLSNNIERDVEKRCMQVHQRKYLEALAANFGQSEGHVATPFTSGFKCVKGPEEESVGEEKRRRFHSLVGSLMYAAVNTRPDVAFVTGQLARVVQCPNEEQVAAGMRVAKYLGQTPTVGLQYSAAAQRCKKGKDGVEPGRLFLTAFSDASYASEPEDMTSVGGFICCVGGGPTAWESKKQVDQALSSVESEYMALFCAVREIVWQRRLLAELGEEQQGPTPLYCDNQGAIALAKNPVLHGLTKHMRVKWHWTRSGKNKVSAVLIPWIRIVRLQLRERFGQNLPVLRRHSDRGGEFSFDLLRDFFMEVARTSMIHAAAPHFLWPFAVRYAAHQLNLWPCVSLPETSPTLRWTGKVGDASVFQVWGSRAFVCDTSADKLSARAIPYPASPLPVPSPYSEQSGGLTELCKPASCPVSPVRTARRAPRSRPPPVPCTHTIAVSPSSVPLRVPLPAPPESSLPEVHNPESDRARASSPTVTRLLATAVTNPSFESAAASALVAELLDFAAACRLDYASALVAESVPASPPSVGDIPTPRSYAEAITDPYSSQWQAAKDAEMASWKSTGTYVDKVPPPRVNIGDGMWIFKVKRPPGSPPAFKARYVAQGFSQRQGVDYFQTLSPTPKMTTLWVLLHVTAQRDYELHSLDFSTAFLQGSLHEEIWLRRPPGFTGSFPAGTQWSLRRPVYGLRLAPREWHDTLRTTLACLGFAPSTADPSLFLRTDTSLPPFYVLVYVDDLVFATADTEALTLVKFELQKRHTCTDLGELRSYLGPSALRLPLLLATSHSSVYQPLALSSTLDESVEPSGLYPELVGCLMYLMTCTRPHLTSPLSLLARYVAPSRHRKVHWDAAKRVLRYLCEAEIYAGAMAAQELRWLTYLLTDLGVQPRSPPVLYVDNKAMIVLCQEHRLEHRTKHIALRYFLARELQQHGQLRLVYVATRANTADVFTKALPPGDHQRFVTVLGLVPTLPHLLTA
ncbi:unnamed protein product [Closterium sp. NIES-54]